MFRKLLNRLMAVDYDEQNQHYFFNYSIFVENMAFASTAYLTYKILNHEYTSEKSSIIFTVAPLGVFLSKLKSARSISFYPSSSLVVWEDNDSTDSEVFYTDIIPGTEVSLLDKIDHESTSIDVINMSPFYQYFGDVLYYTLLFSLSFVYYGIQTSGGFWAWWNSLFNQDENNLISTVKFMDVAGMEKEKNDLKEIISYIKSPDTYSALGATPPFGFLLEGPSGTGKTLIARSLAGEANVPFYYMSGANFVEIYVGEGARKVRELFAAARKNAPAIVFIDEIDAVAPKRSTGGYSDGGASHEYVQTLNQLLVELDGLKSYSSGFNKLPVIFMCATNRIESVDTALLRPGRIDRIYHVDLPDFSTRLSALKIHSRNISIMRNVDFARLAEKTEGLSGADISSVLNTAALLSARNQLTSVPEYIILDVISQMKSNNLKYCQESHTKDDELLRFLNKFDMINRHGIDIVNQHGITMSTKDLENLYIPWKPFTHPRIKLDDDMFGGYNHYHVSLYAINDADSKGLSQRYWDAYYNSTNGIIDNSSLLERNDLRHNYGTQVIPVPRQKQLHMLLRVQPCNADRQELPWADTGKIYFGIGNQFFL